LIYKIDHGKGLKKNLKGRGSNGKGTNFKKDSVFKEGLFPGIYCRLWV
jgi:hypothetical protein